MDATEGIHAGNERFKQAIRAGDSTIMPSLYTTDAKILPPNSEAVSGHNPIAEYWQGLFKLGLTEARPVTLEVIAMGEYALEVGQYSVFGKDHALLDRGKIMVLWREQGGVWKMHRDTWNSSVPLPNG